MRVARMDWNGNLWYPYYDRAGWVRILTNATGTVCYDAHFYPFGGELTFTNTCGQSYKFAGMRRDATTGLDHTRFRQYSSNLGRWYSPDPLGGEVTNPQPLNRYAYVLNNPTTFVDPLGLFEAVPPGCFALSSGFDYFCPSQDGGLGTPGPILPVLPAIPSGGGGGRGGVLVASNGNGAKAASPCWPAGFGFGLSLSGDVEAGTPSSGSAATGSVGTGLFYNAKSGPSAGAFASGGAMTFSRSARAGVPAQTSAPPTSLLGFIGGGLKFFLTNAGSVQQLEGRFSVLSLNAGYGPAQASLQYAWSGSTWQLSISVGPMGVGAGASGSSFTTATATTGAGCKGSKVAF